MIAQLINSDGGYSNVRRNSDASWQLLAVALLRHVRTESAHLLRPFSARNINLEFLLKLCRASMPSKLCNDIPYLSCQDYYHLELALCLASLRICCVSVDLGTYECKEDSSH